MRRHRYDATPRRLAATRVQSPASVALEWRGSAQPIADGPDSAARLLAEIVRRLEANRDIESLVDTVTGPHLARMSRHCAAIARRLGLDETRVGLLANAAPLHDIGKLAIPGAILAKRGPLSPEERTVMRSHARLGYELLIGGSSPILAVGAQIALRHHERFDGSGYPDGLAADEITLEARIVAVADVYDALVSDRPYKRAWAAADALAYLRAERGRQLDPDCVDAMLDITTGPADAGDASGP